MNADSETEQWMPGLLMIGSDAGDSVYGIDLRKDASGERFIETEDVGMSWDYVFWRGRTILDLLNHLNRPA